MPSLEGARARGEGTVDSIRRDLARQAAALLDDHPDVARGTSEVGLIDRACFEPIERPIRTSTSLDGRTGEARRVATVAFTDLEGFTSSTSRAGDRELHHRAVGPVIRSRCGRIENKVLATTEVRSAIGTPPPDVGFGRARRRTFEGIEGSVLVCLVRRAS